MPAFDSRASPPAARCHFRCAADADDIFASHAAFHIDFMIFAADIAALYDASRLMPFTPLRRHATPPKLKPFCRRFMLMLPPTLKMLLPSFTPADYFRHFRAADAAISAASRLLMPFLRF